MSQEPIANPAVTSEPVHEVIAARWSPRAFDPNKKVDRKTIVSLLEAARWAPSCFGDEPWRFIVFDRHTDQAAWQKAFDCLVEGNQVWVKNAPVIAIVLASLNFRHNGDPNRWAKYDTGAAAENLCLQATACGLVSHQMGGFKEKTLMETFSIPETYEAMSMIAIGHQGDAGSLSNELQMQESRTRKRLELGQIAFDGSWSNPLV